jgi:S-layer protein (TIGR01567 family)
MNKPTTVLVLLMLSLITLTTATVVSAQVNTNEVEVRGEVFSIGNVGIGNVAVSWDAKKFAGFWYDIDDNKSTESLEVLKFKDSRTIDKDQLRYITNMASQRYKVFKEKNLTVEHGLGITNTGKLFKPSSPAKGGYYAFVGWMAEKFIAVNGKNNKLSKLVLEQDATDKHTLQVGEVWDIGDGYTLTAQSIDAKATPRQAWLVLSKGDTKLDDKVIAQGEVYTYSKDLAGENDVPIFVTYVDSVFAGQTSDMVQLKYTWAISSEVKEIKSDEDYGIFKVSALDPLTLENDGSVSLSRDSTVDLAGNMKFKIADSDETRFYPFVLINTPGPLEVRGTVSELESATNFSVSKWDARNFAGFWYDIDDNKSTESLQVLKFQSSRTIDKDNLIYQTGRESQKYKVFKEKALKVENGLNDKLVKPTSPAQGGYYAIVGWMAEEYIAVNGKNNKLSKLVLEQDATDKHTLQVGDKWDLGEGYTLTAQSIDAKATPRQAWLVLNKDGTKLDDKVIAQGEVYTYSMKSLQGETDVPIFVTYVDSVFAGQTSDMVQLKYTWIISTTVKEIKSDDSYGTFKVSSLDPLTLKNDGSISLSRDSTVDLAGEMKLKIADSDDNEVRFYPKVDYVIGNVTISGNQTPVPTMTGNQTPVPTMTGGTPVPTGTGETPLPTETGITVATTQKPTPGFEMIFAIAGLLAVAYVILRRR